MIKRALCLSGGGSKGSWMLGVINKLMGEQGLDYSIMTGVSVGALIIAGLSQQPFGSPRESINTIEKFWVDNVSTIKIYKRWFPFGRFHGLWKSSLYDSEPIRSMFKNFFDPQLAMECGRELAVGAVNLNTGKTFFARETHSKFTDFVLASSAFPVFFSPVEIDGQSWSDGGIKETTPLGQAIKMGAEEIDLIITERDLFGSKHWNTKSFKAFPDQLLRTIELMGLRMMKRDVEITKLKNALSVVDSRYRKIKLRIFIPSETLIDNSLNFNPQYIKRMMEIGFRDGDRFIEI